MSLTASSWKDQLPLLDTANEVVARLGRGDPIVILHGVSGSGKTSTLRALGALFTGRTVLVRGGDEVKWNDPGAATRAPWAVFPDWNIGTPDRSGGWNRLRAIWRAAWFDASRIPASSRVDAHTKGIVLIDEIERNLHVIWQGQIVRELITLGERLELKFVVTTHSPYVIDGHENYALRVGSAA